LIASCSHCPLNRLGSAASGSDVGTWNARRPPEHDLGPSLLQARPLASPVQN
jgi:hypothetical protein